MFNVTNHQGNGKPNEVSPHTCQDWYYQKKTRKTTKTTSAGKDMENWNPCILLMGMQNGAATMKNSIEVPQNIKNRTTT